MKRLFCKPGAPAELLIVGARALDPRSGIDGVHDVLVRGGTVAEIGAPSSLVAPEDAETIVADGMNLFPAFVDPHVHLRTPGQEHKETFDSGTQAAGAGGFCAVVAMPNTAPPIDNVDAVRSLKELAGREAHVPVGFLAAVSQGLAGQRLTEMAELRDEGVLGFTDDGLPVADGGLLRRALQYQHLCGGVVALHTEDPQLSADGVVHEGVVSTALGVAGIPEIAESTMVARDIAIAGYEGSRIHIQHLSSAQSVRAVRDGKQRGVKVSAEVCPHHLTLTDEALRTLDTAKKMNPPLRAESDRQALIDGLRSGVIDCIATDHAPHAPAEKDVPFEAAPMGTIGLETAFGALYTELVLPGMLELSVLATRMSAGAALFDLPTPRIAVGEPANLCLVNLEEQWTVGERGYYSRSANSCFAGRTLQGKVHATWAAGSEVFRQRLEVTA
jgi:dihydroorotase